MPTIDAPITACQVCGGPLHDNRNNKKNPKGPDWRCQNEACLDDKGYRTSYWLKQKGPARTVPPTASVKPPLGPVNWAQVQRDYYAAVYCAIHGLAKAAGCAVKDVPFEAVQAGAATILIQLEKQGHRLGTLAPKPAAPKPKPPTAEELAEVPAALQDDGDVPF